MFVLSFILLPALCFFLLFYHTGSAPGAVHWSPDQSTIVYFWWDHSDLWLLVPDGGKFLEQKVTLRWCSIDNLNQQNFVEIAVLKNSRSRLSSYMPLLFSPDSKQVAVKGEDKIYIIDLDSSAVHEMNLNQWYTLNWIDPGPLVSADFPGLTVNNLSGNETPLGYGSGAVSPDGKRTALIDYDQQVVILEENLKKEK